MRSPEYSFESSRTEGTKSEKGGLEVRCKICLKWKGGRDAYRESYAGLGGRDAPFALCAGALFA